MLTSYRSLQSCMPRVHAGRAERGGRGKKWEEEKRGGREKEGRRKRVWTVDFCFSKPISSLYKKTNSVSNRVSVADFLSVVDFPSQKNTH